MKKIILILTPFLISYGLIAQNRVLIEKLKKLKPVEASDKYVPKQLPVAKASNAKSASSGTVYYGTKIGDSYYDLQSNGPAPTNITQYDDGSLAIVYIHNDDMADPLSANRGAGYAYFNASTQTWTLEEDAANGIFDTRVGWPVIGNMGSGEFVIAHGSSPTQIVSVNRALQGAGNWSSPSTTYFNDEYLWPKMAVVGDTIHLLGSCNNCPNGQVNGMDNMMWYSRSTDGGSSFDISMLALPGMDTSNFNPVPFSTGANSSMADKYQLDAVGNTVAVVAGGGAYSMHAWKSLDGGSTWTFYPIADYTDTDTSNGQGYVVYDSVNMTTNTRIFHPGDDPNILIDNNGQMHIFTGALEQSWDGTGTLTWTGRAASSGIMYWNESMLGSRPISITDLLMDIDCNGTLDYALNDAQTGGYGIDNGASRGMACAIDANGNMFVLASSITEGTLDFIRLTDVNYQDTMYIRDLYMVYSTDGGTSWSYPINVASQLAGYSDGLDSTSVWKGTAFGEDVFPSMLKHVGADNMLHMYYQTDDISGTNSNSANGGTQTFAPTVNEQVYYGIDVASVLATTGFNTDSCELNYITGGISEIESVKSIKAFPNPASDRLTLSLDLRYKTDVSIVITDLMGRTIDRVFISESEAGINQIDFSISDFSPGIYLYKVSSGSQIYSEKFIKE